MAEVQTCDGAFVTGKNIQQATWRKRKRKEGRGRRRMGRESEKEDRSEEKGMRDGDEGKVREIERKSGRKIEKKMTK